MGHGCHAVPRKVIKINIKIHRKSHDMKTTPHKTALYKVVFLLQFAALIRFSLMRCSMMLFLFVLTVLFALRELCFVIVIFPGYPHIFITLILLQAVKSLYI